MGRDLAHLFNNGNFVRSSYEAESNNGFPFAVTIHEKLQNAYKEKTLV